MPKRSMRHQGGFTLIEAALTTVIVGTGVLAIVEAQQAYHIKNNWAQHTGTGMQLANEIREMMFLLPSSDPFTGLNNLGPEDNEADFDDYDDIDDFAGEVDEVNGTGEGTVFDPPIDALRNPIDNMDGWSQEVEVVNVLTNDISADDAQPLGTTDLMRVTVTVRYQPPGGAATTITRLTWVTTGL